MVRDYVLQRLTSVIASRVLECMEVMQQSCVGTCNDHTRCYQQIDCCKYNSLTLRNSDFKPEAYFYTMLNKRKARKKQEHNTLKLLRSLHSCFGSEFVGSTPLASFPFVTLNYRFLCTRYFPDYWLYRRPMNESQLVPRKMYLTYHYFQASLSSMEQVLISARLCRSKREQADVRYSPGHSQLHFDAH